MRPPIPMTLRAFDALWGFQNQQAKNRFSEEEWKSLPLEQKRSRGTSTTAPVEITFAGFHRTKKPVNSGCNTDNRSRQKLEHQMAH